MAKDWKKDLGFLEGLMFDPISMGVLGGLQGIMGMFGVSEQNSKIDEISDEYKKMKLSEDQMARRQSETKRMYGSMVDSMIGAGQYLNSDTAKAVAMSKLTGQSMEAQLKQRMQDEQRNLQIDEQVTKLQANKKGYLEGIASILSGALQGVFSATQSSMAMGQKQEENQLLREIYGQGKNVESEVISSLTGEVIPKVKPIDTSNLQFEPIQKRDPYSLLNTNEVKLQEDYLAEYIAQGSDKVAKDIEIFTTPNFVAPKNYSPVKSPSYAEELLEQAPIFRTTDPFSDVKNNFLKRIQPTMNILSEYDPLNGLIKRSKKRKLAGGI